jgi:hypothetical protein
MSNTLTPEEDTIDLTPKTEAKSEVTEDINNKVQYQDRHTIVFPISDYSEYIPTENESKIILPASSLKNLKDYSNVINDNPKEITNGISTKEATALALNLNSDGFNNTRDVYHKTINNDTKDYVNQVNYADKTIEQKYLTVTNTGGKLSGPAAVAVFSSLLSTGNVIQVPLWHSGFWLTLRPPTQTELISLEIALANNQVELGRKTNTLIYSNYSVVYNRILVDFILEHKINQTLKLSPEDDIRNYILVQDLYPLYLGLINSMYPSGFDIVRTCVNSTIIDNETKKPKCDFTVTGKVAGTKLLWVNRKILTTGMLELMSSRIPDSVSIDQIKEYQLSIDVLQDKKVDIVSENDVTFTLTLGLPNVKQYIDHGEAWVNDIISKAEELFTEADTAELKHNKIQELVASVVLTTYSCYVKNIASGEVSADDRYSINEILSILSTDDKVYNTFMEQIPNYISKAVIAIVATPNYICPTCNSNQNEISGVSNPNFKEHIPLNMLEYFFGLSALRTAKTQSRYTY